MKEINTIPVPGTSNLNELYNEDFYKGISLESLESARIYLSYLWNYIQFDSVLDVGCGRGAWLKACSELGSQDLNGYDGDWNSQSMMIDGSIKFSSIDLNKPFSLDKKIDLLITLEVAEHLEPSTSAQFIKCLTDASDTIVFSAAYINQGGTNHINEQSHSYWADLFIENGYVPFDFFRPVFWGNEDVGFCYRQNTFLYLKKDSGGYNKIIDAGFPELEQIQFMDCIHPSLYNLKCGEGISFTLHLKELIPSLINAIKRRIAI